MSDTKLFVSLYQQQKLATDYMNHFKSMQYFVAQHGDEIGQLADSVEQSCAYYEKGHGKDLASLDALLKKVESFSCESTPSDWTHLQDSCNKALRHYRQDWTSWPVMASMFELYISRALLSAHLKKWPYVKSDLCHAYTILSKFCQQEEMICNWFIESGSVWLLATMIELQVSLLENLESNQQLETVGQELADLFPIDIELKTSDDIEAAIQVINKLAKTADKVFQQEEIKDNNYQISAKVAIVQGVTGRRFIAQEHLTNGEVVLVEKATMTVQFWDQLHQRCGYCHGKLITFWPCEGCTEVVFCSYNCFKDAYSLYHRAECRILGYLLGEQGNNNSIVDVFRAFAIFGLDTLVHAEEIQEEPFRIEEYLTNLELKNKSLSSMSPTERILICRALTSLVSHRGKRHLAIEHTYTLQALRLLHCLIIKGLVSSTITTDRSRYAVLLEVCARFMLRTSTNGFSWTETETSKRIGSAVYILASFFNHSCAPNVRWVIDCDASIRLTTLGPIAPGEELFANYGPVWTQPLVERQGHLASNYCFYCRCGYCLRDVALTRSTIICQNANCHGPVVTMGHRACLTCGSVVPEMVAQKLASKMLRAEVKFYHELRSCLKRKGFLAVLFRQKKPRPKQVPLIESTDSGTRLLMFALQTQEQPVIVDVSTSRLGKLQAAFRKYTSIAFSGYHCLTATTLMLMVFGKKKRRFSPDFDLNHLIDTCLAYINPLTIDFSVGHLVNALDYLANYYGQVVLEDATNLKLSNSKLIRQEEDKFQQRLYEMNSLAYRLNAKLITMLAFDLEHESTFFPVTSSCLKKTGRIPSEEMPQDDDERYYRAVYWEAQRRLAQLEA